MIRAAASLALLLAVASASVAAEAPAGEKQLIPPDGFLGEWRRDGAAEVYVGEALYNHIDGGAELFFEFGFEAATVQRFKAADDEIDFEVYRMSAPAAALGIYLMKCGKEVRDPGFAPRHTIGSFQLTFVRGRHFVVATHPEGRASRRAALVAFGRFAADQIADAPPPALLDELPKDRRIERSMRLVRGPYALQSVVSLAEGDFLNLGGKVFAAAADYEQEGAAPWTQIVAVYPSPQDARAAFAELRRQVGRQASADGAVAGRGVPTPDPLKTSSAGSFRFEAERAGVGEAFIDGARLTLRVGLAPPAPSTEGRPGR